MVHLIPWRNKQHVGEQPETHSLATLRDEMDRLFEGYIREPFGALDWPWAGRGQWVPTIDISDSDDEVVVRAEVPGIDPKDLNVSITGHELVLNGEKRESSETKEKNYYRSESRYGSFHRTVPLPEGVDAEHVDAQYCNGVLTLKLKKSPAFAPKRIEVKVK